jgi:alpha-glucosidase
MIWVDLQIILIYIPPPVFGTGGDPYLSRRAYIPLMQSLTSRLSTIAILTVLSFSHASAAFVTERSLASPDGELTFTLERDDADSRFHWSVNRAGNAIVTRGTLGIDLAKIGTIGDKGAIRHVETRNVDTTWKPPFGENSLIRDRFREETLTLTHPNHANLVIKLQVRAYDEGIAFRYLVNGVGELTMSGEKTSYPLPESAMVWVTPASQGSITKVPITAMKNGMERPLTAELSPDLFIALGEAGSFDHARMKFSRIGSSTLIPALGGTSAFTDSLTTPWRYVRAAASPSGLLQGNHLLLNLSEPARLADPSWLRPGKVLREVTLTTAGGIAAADWAAAHGIEFIHLDAGWYGNEYSSDSDATTVTVDPRRSPGPLNLPEVISHAKSKNIGVILYVNRRALETQLDELMPLYQKWGVAGIKFGFVNTGNQQWTRWLHESIEKCAKHRLMVNVHDDYRMMGIERTLPNLMTAEGIRGDEESPSNEMVLHTIFTRCLAGAADQTNCYFAPRVKNMGSHASQLAKSICIYSPWQYLYWYDRPADSPSVGGAGSSASVIQDVPELSFFTRLPTVWDETRWLDGHPDTHATVARRKGGTWFIGGLNGAAARDFRLPLDFLPDHQNYRLEVFFDSAAAITPTNVRIDVSEIKRGHVIDLNVAARSGFAAILEPVSEPLDP